MGQDSDASPKNKYQVPATHSQKWTWVRRILASEQLSASAKNLATALLIYHNETTGQCNPLQQTLARSLGLGRTYVNGLVTELENAGWIAVQRTRGANLYRLEIDHTEAEQDTSEMSANDNIRSPQMPTSDVGNREHLDVGNSEHRTSTQNLRPIHNGEPHSTGRMAKALVASPTNRAASSTVVSEAKPEVVTFHGLKVPTSEIERWQGLFPTINVPLVINKRARWAMSLPSENGRRLKALETELGKAEEAVVRERAEATIKAAAEAEANAKHQAKRSRPAI